MSDEDERIRIIGADEARAAMLRGESPRRPEAQMPADQPEHVDEHDDEAWDDGAWDDEAWGPAEHDDDPDPDEPADPIRTGGVLGADAVVRARAATPDPGAELPHWTEPPTGQLPSIFADEADEEDDLDAWGDVAGPRADDVDWGGEGEVIEEHEADDMIDHLGEPDLSPEERIDAVLAAGGPETDVEDLARQLGPPARRRRRVRGQSPTMRLDTAPDHDDPDYLAPPPSPQAPAEDIATRVLTGVAVAVVALLILHVGGRGPGSLLVALVSGLATAELYAAVRARGSRPATLAGIVAAAAFPPVAYLRGEAAFPLVIGLFTMTVLLWYLVQANRPRPALNIGMSMLGFGYVGVLAAYGGLLLSFEHGVGCILGVALCAVAYDVVGFLVGRHMGDTRIAPTISPNKTMAGLMGGMSASIIVAGLVVAQIEPWDAKSALALGITVAVFAPLGDLVESMIKRDLGVKDFGGLLPGHGGVLDRFDALLFCLPAVYYLIRVGNIFGS